MTAVTGISAYKSCRPFTYAPGGSAFSMVKRGRPNEVFTVRETDAREWLDKLLGDYADRSETGLAEASSCR